MKKIVHITAVQKKHGVAILLGKIYHRTESFIYLLKVTYLIVFYPGFKL